MTSLTRLGAALLAATLLCSPARADEGQDDVVLLGPPPTSYKTKQVKARFLSVHADCDATLTATFTTPGVAVFLKDSDTSQGAVLSHSFRIKPLMPGVTILSVAVDFSDPLKDDTVLTVPLTFLPDAKPVGQAIKVGLKPLLGELKAAGQAQAAALADAAVAQLAAVDFSTLDGAEEAVAGFLDEVVLPAHEGAALASADAVDGLQWVVLDALDQFGFLSGDFGQFAPGAAQLGACEERDAAQHKLDAASDKLYEDVRKVIGKSLDDLLDKAVNEQLTQIAVEVGGLVRSGAASPGGIDAAGEQTHVDTLHLAAAAARVSMGGETRLMISGTVRQNGGNDVEITLSDVAALGQPVPVSLGTPDADGFRRLHISDGLEPGRHYSLTLTDVSTGDTREVFVTTPGAAAVQAG